MLSETPNGLAALALKGVSLDCELFLFLVQRSAPYIRGLPSVIGERIPLGEYAWNIF